MSKSIQITFRGIPINVSIKNVKNISLRISPRDLKVKMTVPTTITSQRILQILEEKYDWLTDTIKKLGEKILNEPKPNPEHYRRFYVSFPPIFEKWEKQMNIYATKVTFRHMTSCWGSCRSQTRSLTFNLRLADKPLECVEYVIIHELAHIIHPNHSPEFWKLVEQHCPDYRRIRTLLKT